MATIRQLSNLQQLTELDLPYAVMSPLELPNRQDRPLANMKRLNMSFGRGYIPSLTVANYVRPMLAWMPNLKLLTGKIRKADLAHLEPILKALQDGGVRCQIKEW